MEKFENQFKPICRYLIGSYPPELTVTAHPFWCGRRWGQLVWAISGKVCLRLQWLVLNHFPKNFPVRVCLLFSSRFACKLLFWIHFPNICLHFHFLCFLFISLWLWLQLSWYFFFFIFDACQTWVDVSPVSKLVPNRWHSSAVDTWPHTYVCIHYIEICIYRIWKLCIIFYYYHILQFCAWHLGLYNEPNMQVVHGDK